MCYCRQGQARPCAPSLKGQFGPVMDVWGFCSVHWPLWTCGVVRFSGKIPAWRRHSGSDTRLHTAGAAPPPPPPPSSKFSGGRFGPNLPGNKREFSGPKYSPQPAGHEAAFKSGRLCTQTPAGSRQAASLPKKTPAVYTDTRPPEDFEIFFWLLEFVRCFFLLLCESLERLSGVEKNVIAVSRRL